MLVLSRRLHEKIVFPGIDAQVQIVSVKPGVVRLGIEAPAEVAVFRDEVWARDGDDRSRGYLLREQLNQQELRELGHRLRNQINTTGIGLDLLRRQLAAGLLPAAQKTLQTLEAEIAGLREQAQGLSQPQPPVPETPRPLRALLAEDNQNERELFAGLLRMAGLEVETAGDGDAVLDYLGAQGCPDVLLLDMRLPHRDGPATLRAIRQEPSFAALKIFAVSGYAPDYFGLDAAAAGVDRWFLKPIHPEVLLRELTQALHIQA